MVGLGGGDGGTSSYLVVARGCWLPVEDDIGENFLLCVSPTSLWVTGPGSTTKCLMQVCGRMGNVVQVHHHLYMTGARTRNRWC